MQPVREAYGMKPKEDAAAFLLALNQELAQNEATGDAVMGPGLPTGTANPARFVTADCITAL